jgi:transposase-like protein
MGMRSEAVFQNLRTRIEEENSIPGKRRAFSKGTKIEVLRLLNEGYRASILAGQLGISESAIGKWKKQKKETVFQPKKLKVVDDFEGINLPNPQPVRSEKIEVQFPNGVILKNLILDANTLALLRRC